MLNASSIVALDCNNIPLKSQVKPSESSVYSTIHVPHPQSTDRQTPNDTGHICYNIPLTTTTYCLLFLLFAHHLRHGEFVFAFNDSLFFYVYVCNILSCSVGYIVSVVQRQKQNKKKEEK